MIHSAFISLIMFTAVSLFTTAYAQTLDKSEGAVEVTEPAAADYPAKGAKGTQPKVGRKAAEKFMGQKGDAPAKSAGGGGGGSSAAHYLAVHVGHFISDNSYKWGAPDSQSGVGRLNFGVTYRMGEWVNSMDMGIRIDVTTYKLSEGDVSKLSFSPVIMFPDASSKFPLYFGAGAGLGVFMKQLNAESSIALDYQIFGGVRFFDVLNNTGFFVEAGLKNHFLLLSDGQFNGTYATVGTVSTF